MKKLLFEKMFEKAEDQSGSTTRNGKCVYLERVFMNDKVPVNRETFIRYYRKYIENDSRITNNPNTDLLNKASKYIGYEDYEDFVTKNKKKEKDEEKPPIIILGSPDGGEEKKETINNGIFNWVGKNRKVVIINLMIIITAVIIISTNIVSKNKERWMIWQDDHYVEIEFNITNYYKNELELYDQKKLENFKKIKNPDCDTPFFNEKGEPATWYWKRGKNDLEIYTAPGIHPTNGKTLKPITRYMIKEHICKE